MLNGGAQGSCKSTLNPPYPDINENGWCYVDPAQDSEASCDVVQSCPAQDKRKIRFNNVNSEPRPGAATFLRCATPPLTTKPTIACQ